MLDCFTDLINTNGVACDGVPASTCSGRFRRLDGTPVVLMDEWFPTGMLMNVKQGSSPCIKIRRITNTSDTYIRDETPCKTDDVLCECYAGKEVLRL